METKRIVVEERVVRYGTERQSFLDSCDPYGIPFTLKALDFQLGIENRIFTLFVLALMWLIAPPFLPVTLRYIWATILILGAPFGMLARLILL